VEPTDQGQGSTLLLLASLSCAYILLLHGILLFETGLKAGADIARVLLAALPSAIVVGAWYLSSLALSLFVDLGTACTLAACCFTAYLVMVRPLLLYSLWRHDFSARHERTSPRCPSHGELPKSRSQGAMLKRAVSKVASNSSEFVARHTEELLLLLPLRRSSLESDELKERARPFNPAGLKPMKAKSTPSESNRDNSNVAPHAAPNEADARSKAHERMSQGELDMDHVRVGFLHFLAVYYFVFPNAIIAQFVGINWLLLRVFLQHRGWLKPKPCDAATIVGRLLFELPTQMISYQGITDAGDGCGKVVKFAVSNALLLRDGKLFHGGLFECEVALESRRLKYASLNGNPLTAREALTLIAFDASFGSHVRLHAIANWSICSTGAVDEFIQSRSALTGMYNYFGYTWFPRVVGLWVKVGIASRESLGLPAVFKAGLQKPLPRHGHLRELGPHSHVASFVLKLRNAFLNVFADHKHCMPDADGEALFVATVLHSLEHSLFAQIVQDELWLLDTRCSAEYGAMGELTRLARAGFVDDVPGLLFSRRFREARHPFYAQVYDCAVKLNPELADMLDTCVIK